MAQSAQVRAGRVCLHAWFPPAGNLRFVAAIAARGKAGKARFRNLAEGPLEGCRYYLIRAHDLGYGGTGPAHGLLEEVSELLNAYARAILSSVS